MSIRVIAGSVKGRRLKMVPGLSTRPVMDRVKEACFSIIGRDIIDSAFLDLFAGTGSVGIEALSRGARSATFIDTDRKAIQTIQENLKLTGFTEQAVVRRLDALSLLRKAPGEAFDFIYIAPPQYKGMWLEALQALDDNPAWLAPEAKVIVQIDPSEQQQVSLRHLAAYDERRYGKTLLWFFSCQDSNTRDTSPES